jgi:hypothetical protein
MAAAYFQPHISPTATLLCLNMAYNAQNYAFTMCGACHLTAYVQLPHSKSHAGAQAVAVHHLHR